MYQRALRFIARRAGRKGWIFGREGAKAQTHKAPPKKLCVRHAQVRSTNGSTLRRSDAFADFAQPPAPQSFEPRSPTTRRTPHSQSLCRRAWVGRSAPRQCRDSIWLKLRIPAWNGFSPFPMRLATKKGSATSKSRGWPRTHPCGAPSRPGFRHHSRRV